MIITNSRYALVGYFITSYPTRAHGIIVKYSIITPLNFIDYASLRETTSSHIVNCMKSMFARFGIPEKVISDNGPQYDSKEFKKFAEKWKFLHMTTSPRYPQGNDKAENAAKTSKALMKKNRDASNDIYLALLDWRNTPSEDLGSSPAQRLLGRRTRTQLPEKKGVLST